MLGTERLSINVFVIAPPLACWGLERLIATAHPRLSVLGTASTVQEALPLLVRQPADVVLVDMDGPDIAASVEHLCSGAAARLLLLTASTDTTQLDQAVLGGLRGVMMRNDAPAVLLKALEKVHDGELWLDRNATGRIFMEIARTKAAEGTDPEKTKIATLTSRERQTIAAVASDASVPAKVIAGRLCISEHTLRNHLTSIYGKLDLANRLDLYAFATRHRLDKPL